MVDARIQFKALKGFPNAADKIETQTFLNAAKEIVTVIGKFRTDRSLELFKYLYTHTHTHTNYLNAHRNIW